MNDLIEKAQLFYKLAQEIIPAGLKDPEQYKKMKDEYDQLMSVMLTNSLTGVNNLIYTGYNLFHKYDFFNLDDIMKIFTNTLFTVNTFILENILSDLQHLSLTERPDIDKQIRAFALKKYIDNHMDKIDIVGYLQIERASYLPENYLRKVQAKMVKHLVELTHGSNPQDMEDSIQSMTHLMTHSRKFNEGFLERVAKHIGPGYYARVMQHFNPKSHFNPKELKQKETLTAYDIAQMFAQKSKGLGRGHFLGQIIAKADDKAKQYLRSFLYSDGIEFFMLDEEMKPMNEKYKRITWPAQFYPILNWNILMKEDREKWFSIFAEFQMVPTTSFV